MGEANRSGKPDPEVKASGRPRLSGRRQDDLTPKDEIILVATRLFMERGYTQTTMRDIAHAAGLRQSSLYYYFNRKEQILEASVAVNTAPLDFLRRLDAGSPGLRLYRFVRFDTRQLCMSPWDVNEVERLANRHPSLFRSLWETRQQLHDQVMGLLHEGMESGQFLPSDPTLTTLGLTSFNEGVQNWYRNREVHRPGGDSPFVYPSYDVEDVADLVATSALRLVLADPSSLEEIKREAAHFADD